MAQQEQEGGEDNSPSPPKEQYECKKRGTPLPPELKAKWEKQRKKINLNKEGAGHIIYIYQQIMKPKHKEKEMDILLKIWKKQEFTYENMIRCLCAMGYDMEKYTDRIHEEYILNGSDDNEEDVD